MRASVQGLQRATVAAESLVMAQSEVEGAKKQMADWIAVRNNRIWAAVTQRHLTQAQVADVLGMSTGTIGRIVAAERRRG